MKKTKSSTQKEKQDQEEKKEEETKKLKLKQNNKKAFKVITKINKSFQIQSESLFTYKRHPYGILPNGSAIANNTSIQEVRYKKLGHNFCSLKDDIILYILSYCDISSICNLIKCNNSYFYILCHTDDLWRDLSLSYYLNSSMTNWNNDNNNNNNNHYYKCWKDMLLQKTHEPIIRFNYYSDYLFQSWYVMNYNIDSILPSITTIDKLHYSNAKDVFLKTYQAKNVPCIISSIPNLPKNVSIQYLYDNIQGNDKDATTFRATSGTASQPADFTLKSYLQYCYKTQQLYEDVPLYLFDRCIQSKLPNVCQDVLYNSLYPSCPFWDSNVTPTHDLFRLLDEKNNDKKKQRRPDYQWIIIGPKRSGSIFHIDPNSTNAWNITLKGSKLWILYPPNIVPPGVHPSKDLDTVVLPMSMSEWIYHYWNDHLNHRKKGQCLEAITHPGDVIFVPHNWWHCVINLGDDDNDNDDNTTIALTMNYACHDNLQHVLWFLKNRKDQISGVRDRKGADAIQPDKLYDEFHTSLMKSGLYADDEDFLNVDDNFICSSCQMKLQANSSSDDNDDGEMRTKRKNQDAITNNMKEHKKKCNLMFQGGMNCSNNDDINDSTTASSNGFAFSFF